MSSLDSTDVFILDMGAKIYLWLGKGCNKDEKMKVNWISIILLILVLIVLIMNNGFYLMTIGTNDISISYKSSYTKYEREQLILKISPR